MPLSSNPSRDNIWIELAESNYRNGGANVNWLKNMHDYVFGTGSYSRDAFGGYGIPQVSTLTLSAGDGEIDCTFDVDNLGGFTVTIVAEYWHSTTDPNLMGGNYQEIGTVSSTGRYTRTLTGLTNGQSYDVRITAYHKFNNSGNYPEAPATNSWWDWTNQASATPEQPQLDPPTVTDADVVNFNNGLYVVLSADGNQDSITIQVRINGSSESHSVDCTKNIGGTVPEIRTNMSTFLNGETVEVRAKSTGSAGDDSNWSGWFTASYESSIPSCPL